MVNYGVNGDINGFDGDMMGIYEGFPSHGGTVPPNHPWMIM